MAERHDWDRERDRERGRSDWDRNREFGERGREDWDRERGRESYGREPHGGEPGRESRWGDYGREPRGGEYGRESYGSETRHYSPERGDYSTRGDWGRQGSWGAYGNRPEFDREDEWRRGQGNTGEWGQRNAGEWERGRRESGYGGAFGGYGGGMGSYGGGMSRYSERGRFSGRGPKGWQRSDERIKDDVSERLSDHPDIDASEIEVQVRNGEITLIGIVDHRYMKRMAEDIAERVSGVKDVHNQLRVEKSHAQENMAEQGRTGTTTGTGTTTRTK